jgi:hypothetical protein
MPLPAGIGMQSPACHEEGDGVRSSPVRSLASIVRVIGAGARQVEASDRLLLRLHQEQGTRHLSDKLIIPVAE